MESDKQKVSCSKCKGKGTVLRKEIKLLDICPRCKGEGETDWVSDMMGIFNPEIDIEHRVIYENIQYLASLLHKEGMKAGIQIVIEAHSISYGPEFKVKI